MFCKIFKCCELSVLAEYPLGDECSYRVHRALEMLYCCPIPRQVNLALMLQHCKRLYCDELVTRLQPFLSLTQLKHPKNHAESSL